MNWRSGFASLVLTGIAGWTIAGEKPGIASSPAAKVREPAPIIRTTVVPCPEPKPAFDHARIDRTLKEPRYVSDKPLYRFFAFGLEGRQILAMVLDESQGTGKGYDVYYADLNLDRDITGELERFECKKPLPAAISASQAAVCDDPGPDGTPACLVGIPAGLRDATPPPPIPVLSVNPEPAEPAALARKLEIADPLFEYSLNWEGGKWTVRSLLKSGDWHTRLAIYSAGNVWSADKARAPVYRFGGTEWTFHNSHLAGRAFKPGDPLVVDAVSPFFAGASPEIPFRQGGCWVYGGYIHARYWLESLERPGEASRLVFAGNTCCGGSHASRILVPADMPHGRAELVLSMDTPDAYLGRVVQRIPLRIDNPDHGKPLEELAFTTDLRRESPDDTVVELFQGADLSAWGLGEYDGARDVFIGGDPETGAPSGAQSLGNAISYSYDCRDDLRVGTVRACRTLLRFDLSPLPRESRVKKAFLRIMAASVKANSDRTTRVSVLRTRWHEDLSNGQTAFGAQSMAWGGWYNRMPFPVGHEVRWEKPFAMGASDRFAEPVGTMDFPQAGWSGIELTDTVRKWVAGELPNHGVVMELANPQNLSYAVEVNMVSSDNPAFPRGRPCLVLVLEKGFKPVAAPAIAEQAPDLDAARARAKTGNKLVLCNILSRKSVTCWSFQKMLENPAVADYLARNYEEIRIDADKPEHRKLLDFYAIKHLPTALVIRPGATPEQDVFDRFEPLRWNTRFGKTCSWFETPETYTLHLEFIRTNGSATMPWRRLSDGTLCRLDSHSFYQRFDGNGGIVRQ